MAFVPLCNFDPLCRLFAVDNGWNAVTQDTSSEEKLSPVMFSVKQCAADFLEFWCAPIQLDNFHSHFSLSVWRKVLSHTITRSRCMCSVHRTCLNGQWLYSIWPICICPTRNISNSMGQNRRNLLRLYLFGRVLTFNLHSELTLFATAVRCRRPAREIEET